MEYELLDLLEEAINQGDTATANAVKQKLFSMQEGQATSVPEDVPSTLDNVIGGAEAGATLLSGMAVEPIAGLSGIAQTINPFAEAGAGERAVEGVREALTYQPRTEEGIKSIQSVGEAMKPVGDVIGAIEQGSGDIAYDAVGSLEDATGLEVPESIKAGAGAVGQIIPTVAAELAGVGLARRAATASKAAKKAKLITVAAPGIESIEKKSRAIYKTLDDAGAKISDDAFLDLATDIEKTAIGMGHDFDVTPAVQGVINRFDRELGKTHSVSNIETLRDVAKGAAKSTNTQEKAIGVAMISKIDDFFDDLKASDLNDGGDIPADQVGPMYKQARELWGRKRRSEMLTDAIEDANLQASGQENGIRIAFRQILKNKKKKSFFSESELKQMGKVVKGTSGANLAKLLGKFGLSENQATNFLGGTIGMGGGAAIGSVAGAPGAAIGAVAVPAIGQVSKNLATRLTKGNADFAEAVVRAGKNADEIVESYIKYTPEADIDPAELRELLLNNEVPIEGIEQLKASKVKAAVDAAIIMTAPPSQEEAEIEQNNAKLMEKGNSIVSSYNAKEDPIMTAIDMQSIVASDKPLGMDMLSRIYSKTPEYVPVAESFIDLAMARPDYRSALQGVKNVLRNEGIIPPDNKGNEIDQMISVGIKPERAVMLSNQIKPINKIKVKSISDSIRNKIRPEMYSDFSKLINAVEGLA